MLMKPQMCVARGAWIDCQFTYKRGSYGGKLSWFHPCWQARCCFRIQALARGPLLVTPTNNPIPNRGCWEPSHGHHRHIIRSPATPVQCRTWRRRGGKFDCQTAREEPEMATQMCHISLHHPQNPASIRQTQIAICTVQNAQANYIAWQRAHQDVRFRE